MTTLISPGVDIEITADPMGVSAGAGTVPLIVFATAANKSAVGTTGIAPGTLPTQANTLYQSTSQRDWLQYYGAPLFYSANGTPLNGYELNEYGLHAGYSYLGVANQVWGLRADIDLAALQPSVSAPVGPPVSGTIWFDTSASSFGLFQSNGNTIPGLAWVNQTVQVPTEAQLTGTSPANNFGTSGQFAVVTTTASNYLYQNIGGTWFRIGSASWRAANPTVMTGSANPTLPVSGDISINGTDVTLSSATTVSAVANSINTQEIMSITASVSAQGALVITNTAGGSITLAGSALTALGFTAGVRTGVQVQYTNTPQYPANSNPGDIWIKLSAPNNGASWSIKQYNGATSLWQVLNASFQPFNSSLSDGTAGKDAQQMALGAVATGYTYVGFDNTAQVMEIRRFNGAYYETASYEAQATALTTSPAAGTFWYNSDFQADILVSDGEQWQAFSTVVPGCSPNGPILSGSAPTLQDPNAQGVQGTLVTGDLWIDTSDLENYPMIYRWDATQFRWLLIDNTDDTSPFGIVFADARQDAGPLTYGTHTVAYSTTASQMILSYNVDPDAPDPRTYPAGMLLFNTRYATYNVKQWSPNWFINGGFDPNTNYTLTSYNIGSKTFVALTSAGRWVTASGNKTDGSPYMGRKAQRIMVVRALAAAVANNEAIRSEQVYFNLVAAPGYPELIDELNSMNTDNKESAFVVGDTPARLASDATSITNWATNANNVSATGEDGLVTASDYTGLYYPWGMGTNTDGTNVMIPPSTIALVTIAYNDQVAYPWFAPAGFTRGMVTNASSVGYLNATTGQYTPVVLNQGQRDVLYSNNINPIAYIPGRGLVLYGQKTLSGDGTALTRINVARLCNYLRYNLDIVVKPFLFEPNDTTTQTAAGQTVSRFLNGLVGLRALQDYAVLCDSTNNTPDRVDANELWIDVLIQPTMAIEFIYVPVRILNAAEPLTFGTNI